jgi:hypothetical protein
MHWNSAMTASSARAPKFISPSALSVSVTVNGGTPSYLNAPVTTLAIVAPVGNDTFTFQTYDETNGQGNVLGRASVTEDHRRRRGQCGVGGHQRHHLCRSRFRSASPATAAGTAATMPVNVSALDADGNIIVGPGYYTSPINLAINDPCEHRNALAVDNVAPGPHRRWRDAYTSLQWRNARQRVSRRIEDLAFPMLRPRSPRPRRSINSRSRR